MYLWMWHRLPGPLLIRIILAVLLIGLAIAGLFHFVFPGIAPLLEINDGAIRE